ncbi:RND family efflux transporter, MFP subunit [Colwellia chukchiensis]|uniref:RND family efflux transporter, MFP subunit n=1 Tax=Colwellia chukchiensis TaxID=641665 RepID=A0A1H7TC46_9GAMM|nr:efflux RND transporter periplasmic adaptor subunit [Colwellia chukchiensis]SEL82079.1 RND family efflux transporter, MFP subunit [Colwellia chukchiensis]
MSAVVENNNKSSRRMIPLRYVLTPIAIIVAAVIGLIIFAVLSPKPAKKPVIIKPPLVEVQEIARANLSFTIASQGNLVPRTQTQIVSEVAGQIDTVNEKFQVGGFFSKGEVLLQINDSRYQVALLQAQARLEAAKALLVEEQARKKQAEDEWRLTGRALSEAPILAIRVPQLQKAQADVNAAKADVLDAKVKLARTHITAPYDAIIKAQQVDIGQYVNAGSVLATLFAVDYAEVRLPIKQRDVEFLTLPKINQPPAALSNIDIYYHIGGKEYHWPASLSRYEGEVDSRSRVHYVVAEINDPYGIFSANKSQELRIGTFVKAKITGKEVTDIVTLPREALHGANQLYLIDENNRLKIQKINILRHDAEHVYSYDQFAPGLRLVTTQLQTPVDGMALRVVGELVDNQTQDEPNSLAAENAQGNAL